MALVTSSALVTLDHAFMGIKCSSLTNWTTRVARDTGIYKWLFETDIRVIHFGVHLIMPVYVLFTLLIDLYWPSRSVDRL